MPVCVVMSLGAAGGLAGRARFRRGRARETLCLSRFEHNFAGNVLKLMKYEVCWMVSLKT